MTRSYRHEHTGKRSGQGGRLLRAANRCLFACAALAALAYIATANDIVIKGIVMKDLRIKARDLNETHRQLELAVMELKSYDRILARARELDMVEAPGVTYLTLTPTAVARR
jgi:hypothetical protein